MALISTTTPILASASYTSPVQLAEYRFGRIAGTVFSDQAGTIFLEQSSDGTNWDVSTSYAISANDGKGFNEELVGTTWRIRYVNGTTNQTTFRLFAQTRL